MIEDVTVYTLKHAVRLSVRNTSGRLELYDVADFLAKAMRHFKYHRDDLRTGPYTLGPWDGTAVRGRQTLGTLRLDVSDGTTLTAEQWTEAVIDGYVNANTLEQIAEELPAYRAAAQKSGGWLLEVVRLLGQRGGGLLALQAKLSQPAH